MTHLQHGYDWPTFQELIDAGKRVVFMSGTDYSPEGDDLLFVKESICDWREPPLPFVPFPTCRFHRPNTGPLDENRTIFRPETSEIVYGFLNADGQIGANKYLLDETSLPPLVDCGVNIPSPDNITPKRMESTIWAIARGERLERGKCIGITRAAESSWVSVDCDAPHMVAACVDTARPNAWRLGADAVVEAKSAASCATLVVPHHRMSYGVPASGYENRLVRDLLASAPASVTGVWVDARTLVDEIYFADERTAGLAVGSEAAERSTLVQDDTLQSQMRQEHSLVSVE